MKARPRSVEREVATYLSSLYSLAGYGVVERIPILGRTGPDITINETGFVIDVKSRISVPKSHMLRDNEIGRFGLGVSADYFGVRLNCLGHTDMMFRDIRPSIMVWDWLCHMDEWTQKYMPNGISAIILHRPGTRIANTTFVVKIEDWRNVCQRMIME
jgi:hypothetical protein